MLPFTQDQLLEALPQIESLGALILTGGQKAVFPCVIGGENYALKILLLDDSTNVGDGDVDPRLARAEREVGILQSVVSPHLVRIGPIELVEVTIGGHNVAIFTEEWIAGETLGDMLNKNAVLSAEEVLRLGIEMASAIEVLAGAQKIHRDIKPGNIMRRTDNGQYILLDMGLVFDLADVSLTATGYLVGTMGYFSPEQLDPTKRRDIDFRSDLFVLGIVLYQAATGRHPFREPGMWSDVVLRNILYSTPKPVTEFRNDIPSELSAVIMRLLSKVPHMRYRSCQLLLQDLKAIG